ncbi:MAG: hypothetical protein ACHQQQ_15185 [Bacteroidota bacterium]
MASIVFEKETETIITSVKQRIPHSITDSSAVVVKDIMAADIPYPLKSFFRADVEILLTEELNKQWKNSRFNFFHPEVQSLQHQINSFLVVHYSFQKEEFHQRLDDAVHLIINYLIRPQWTLASVVFESQDTISTSNLMRLLKYFGPYEYIRSLILRYIENRRIASFTKPEFSEILWKVDGQFVRRKTGDQLAKILTPLYEFMEYPANSGVNALPIKGLIKHFEDKGLTSVVRRLEDELKIGKGELNRQELGELLESQRRISGAFEIERRIQAQETPASLAHETKSPDEKPEEQKETQSELPKAIIESMEEPENEIEETDSSAIPNEEPRADFADSLAAELSGAATNDPKKPFLLYSIPEGERRKFIKKIFKGDDIQFLDALRKIDEVPTWRQASVYIDEIFIQNDVDPYSSEAIRFIDIIQEKYYPKK